jgi:hypothetical protein
MMEFYNLGYYTVSYRPFAGRSFERFLKYCSQGFLLILLGIVIYVGLISKGNETIPEALAGISVSSETMQQILIFSYLLALITKYTLFLMAISMFMGVLMRWGQAGGVLVETKEKDNTEIICVRQIYDENEDFLYYLDLQGNWGSIRKSFVNSMKHIKKESMLDEWLLKDKKNRYIFLLILLLFLIIILLLR